MAERARAAGRLPRILTIMGSGETAPTMVKVHRSILDKLGPPPVPAVLLDTPFGFQENAGELALRVVNYFAESLRTKIEVASTKSIDSSSTAPVDDSENQFANERIVSRVRDARYIFAGPGSPSYALRKWHNSVVPGLLRETLTHGGAVTFASAAALTLGMWTVPVYEIYKVGEDPFWHEGLDVLSVAGISAAVIPHYNNAEGGTHDTRFCYLGERRLSLLERELPEGAFVLGVDEHTALVMDLDDRRASVEGIGVVTVRAAGRSRTWNAGEVVNLDDLSAVAAELAAGGIGAAAGGAAAGGVAAGGAGAGTGETAGGVGLDPVVDEDRGSPLLKAVRGKEADYSAALSNRDVEGAVGAILELEAEITAWSRDTPAGDELDRAHASLRSLIVGLGQAGESGVRDPREIVGPFVEALLELRRRARAEGRFGDADLIRGRLGELEIEVRDTPAGSEWLLAGSREQR